MNASASSVSSRGGRWRRAVDFIHIVCELWVFLHKSLAFIITASRGGITIRPDTQSKDPERPQPAFEYPQPSVFAQVT